MIEPFFFRDGQVFGCYHPPANSIRSRLLVICPPFFDEYRRSYKALAHLANACAAKGVHVLRFDYSGTGESFGNLDDVSADDWIQDIGAAIEEGMAISGSEEVVLCGIRFGAVMAAQLRHPDIKRYIFWDPVLSGDEYLEWLDDVNQELKEKHVMNAFANNIPVEDIKYENFHLTQKLRESISPLRVRQSSLTSHADFHIISTNASFSSSEKLHFEFIGPEYDWPAYHDGILIQKPVLEAIARRVLKP